MSNAASPTCQKCLQVGHWTYQCKKGNVYLTRPSRTEQLKNPKLQKLFLLNEDDVPKVPRITDGDKLRDSLLYEKTRRRMRQDDDDDDSALKVLKEKKKYSGESKSMAQPRGESSSMVQPRERHDDF